MEDSCLLVRIQARDQGAMSVLFNRYAALVYAVALRVLKDASEAEDVMQEIFVQIWREPGVFVSGRGSLGAWLAVVARNRSIDVLRRRKSSASFELFSLPSQTDLSSEVERNA